MNDELPVDVFLDGFPPEMRAAAHELRRIVTAAVPDAREHVLPGWRLIRYTVPVGRRRTRMFASIGPEAVHVHLFFEYGVLVPDPDRLLEGAHIRLKRVRFMTFTPDINVPEPVIADFLRAAAGVALLPAEARRALADSGAEPISTTDA
ncbi:MAG: DUF1801 domain-containing protein [Chloroflexi bacterium]|nr:DUF1801 domain-containing protein [Chloroflexota bacterium]